MKIMSFELRFSYQKNFNFDFLYVGWGLKFGEGCLGKNFKCGRSSYAFKFGH